MGNVLAHALVTAPGTSPTKWMLMLHGILGSGANWRTFARQIVASRPGWGIALVDLRLHGESQRGFDPPHTVARAAEDVWALTATLPGPARAVFGHSFGGKVAIEVARTAEPSMDHLFIIDSTPSARPDRRGSTGTQHIVDLLGTLPDDFPDRASFTGWMEQRGVSRPLAMWLAMNVKPEPNTTRYVFRIDVRGIRELLDDYFHLDAWSLLEHPPADLHTHFIVGGESDIVDAADLERARRCPQMTVDVIEGAGHWVHADAPDALRSLVESRLD